MQKYGTKYQEMTERPVKPLVISLALPALASNLVTAIYNISDTFFVGHINTAASGAVGVSFVAMTTIQAAGFFLGQGTGNAISRYLGSKQNERANVMSSTGLAAALLLGLLIAILGHVFLEPLCLISGSTQTILPYAKTFIGIILIGAPWMCASLMLNMQMRFEGEASHSMYAIMTGAVLNMLLTPILVFGVGLGIAGSALSTIICEFIGFCLLLRAMIKSGLTKLSPRYVQLTPALAREVFNGGFPSFVRQVMLGVATTLLNNAAKPFGDAAVAAIAIVQRITGFGNYVQIAIGQGFQPVIGFNLGARKYDRIREGYFFSLKVAFGTVLCIGTLTCVFAPELIWFFRNDPEVVRVGTLTLRLVSFTMPLTGAAMITNFLLQTSGKMWRATILGACRLGLVLGPVVLVLSHALGLTGVQISQPVTDLITGLVTVPMAASVLRELAGDEKRHLAFLEKSQAPEAEAK